MFVIKFEGPLSRICLNEAIFQLKFEKYTPLSEAFYAAYVLLWDVFEFCDRLILIIEAWKSVFVIKFEGSLSRIWCGMQTSVRLQAADQ